MNKLLVDDEIASSWNNHWFYANDYFENDLAQDPQFHQFKGKMFFAYNGNHRLNAWMQHIVDFHNDDPMWHMALDCIILDARGKNEVLNVNWEANFMQLFQFLSTLSSFMVY